jgi:hypothetical protein
MTEQPTHEEDVLKEIHSMDGTGDSKLKWKPKDDAHMRKAIEELMAAGHSFHKIEYINGGDISAETPIIAFDELSDRSVVVKSRPQTRLDNYREAVYVMPRPSGG